MLDLILYRSSKQASRPFKQASRPFTKLQVRSTAEFTVNQLSRVLEGRSTALKGSSRVYTSLIEGEEGTTMHLGIVEPRVPDVSAC